MPSRGTLVLPSEDTHTPATPVAADVLLTPQDFDIPKRKRPFTPTELAPHFGVCAKTIERMIDDGSLRGLRVRGVYKIPYRELEYYFMRQQG